VCHKIKSIMRTRFFLHDVESDCGEEHCSLAFVTTLRLSRISFFSFSPIKIQDGMASSNSRHLGCLSIQERMIEESSSSIMMACHDA
jgi:hypothetical protein